MTRAPRIVRRSSAAPTGWPPDMLPLLCRLYAARGVDDARLAQPRLSQLLAPALLSHIDAAAAMLADAIVAGQRILVVGDFDCDGATACAVGVRGLRMLGARDVLHAVPNRIVHGYGLSPALVEELVPLRPQLLVTVDHGIACHAGVAAAKAQGWNVLVTDHHLPGAQLPPADVIVNPNLAQDGFPSKALAGVGVIFYVLLALRATLRERGALGGSEPDLASLLDLVAVGTVADLVPLDANNRALVLAGLRRLRQGRGCIGLRALIQACGRDESRLAASDIGFALAPRLNAAGRLEDMALGIELLLCEDADRAGEIAATLETLNAERRAVQQSMTAEAEAAVGEAISRAQGDSPLAVCLFEPHWHPGVIGLVASRLKERLHRPVVAFAPAEPGSTQLRGSARSIPGVHLRDLLAMVDSRHPGLIERFGGHAMAAGLSLDHARLADFESALAAQAGLAIDPALLQAELVSDGELEAHELDHRHAEALRFAGPWGQAFPEPLFDGQFEVLQWKLLKERHLRYTLRHAGRAEPLTAIHFDGWAGQEPTRRVHIAYRLVADDYRGGNAVQLIVEHCEPLAA